MKLCFGLFFLILFTNSYGQSPGGKPFVLGITEEIQSVLLNEKRLIHVYLPDGYEAKDSTRYPVVYLLDGGADEDFIHIAGLYQYYSFPWINKAPKSIIVGISNVDRQRDFTSASSIAEEKKLYPTAGNSAKFISFLKNELQPFVEKNYNANQDRTIIGQSLAGLLATEILLKHPGIFNRYIIISPSLWWNDGSLLKDRGEGLAKHQLSPLSIYIGVGKEGLAPSAIPHVMEVDANLLDEKIRNFKNKNLRVSFDYLPQETHATILHQAVLNAIKLLY